MKSPLLIIFLLLNLLTVNLSAAANMYDEELAESHLMQAEHNIVANNIALASCLDESSCDHFCHFSAHMAGFVSQIEQISTLNSSPPFIIHNETFYSLSLEPPSQPPRA